MARCSIFLSVFLSILSCQSIHVNIGQRSYEVPQSYKDTINKIINSLDNCQNCNYIVCKVALGNCFGESLVAHTRIIWTDGRHYFQRDITKSKSTNRSVKDHTIEKNSSALFCYFSANHIDTIATLPIGGGTMDPVSYCDIIVKNGALFYNKRFEMTPFFSTTDTLHSLYVFVKLVCE